MMQDPKPQDQEPVAPTAEAGSAETSAAPADPAERIAALTAEIAALNDRLMRALAEVENVRRQKERELEEARKYAITGFARGLLEVADNLRRALSAVPNGGEGRDPLLQTLVTGVEMTERNLLALFEKHRIRKVQPERGERFDPALHQAMFEVQTADLPAGSVAEVLQPGYVLADRLLRPALVGVAKAPTKPAEPEAASGTVVDTEV
jgi:molecular chaperone GrpE